MAAPWYLGSGLLLAAAATLAPIDRTPAPKWEEQLVEEVRLLLPPAERASLRAGQLPPAGVRALNAYRGDDETLAVRLREQFKKDPEEFGRSYPLRVAFFEAAELLEEASAVRPRNELLPPVGPDVKLALKKEQKTLAEAIFLLERAVTALDEARERRDQEKSKRWQAHFDLATARLQERLLYLLQINALMADARTGHLPDLQPGQKRWRLVESAKLYGQEAKVRTLSRDLDRRLRRIEQEYPDSPWSLVAARDAKRLPGLTWQGAD